MKRFVSLLLTALLLSGCTIAAPAAEPAASAAPSVQEETASAPEGQEAAVREEQAQAPADAAPSSLYVQKVEGLSDDFILGADVSTLLAQEQSGVVYRNFEGKEQDMLQTLSENGINYVRVRVWVDPFDEDGNGYGGGNCTAETAGIIGARAAKYGLKLLVDFHYSDFWADPAKQRAPKAWEGLSIDEKAAKVKEYTGKSLQIIKDAGADIGMVQIGNETNTGICGETSVPKRCAIFKAGSEAVRAFDENILIAVHFTNPEAGNFINDYAYKLATQHVDYDVFSTSYYAYWHGTLENLTAQLQGVAEKYGKKVMVAETQWAYTTADGDNTGNQIGEEIKYDKPYPFTVQGQSRLIRDVIQTIADLPTGIGVFYWEAGWIPVPGNSYEDRLPLWEQYGSGWASSHSGDYDPDGIYYGGSVCDNQALFDFEGNPLESLKTFSLVRTGNKVQPQVDDISTSTLTVRVGQPLELPKTIFAIYSDGSEAETPVLWNEDQAAAVDTLTVGKYMVEGDAGGRTARCQVNVVDPNFLDNYSLEEADRSMWKLTMLNSGKEPDYQVKSTDAYSGEVSLHFWDPNEVNFEFEQTVKNLPADTTWRISVQGQGGSGQSDPIESGEIYLYVKADGQTYTAPLSLTGWVKWDEGLLEHIPCTSGEMTVGIHVHCGAGCWGTFDDFLLNPEQ